ncbi:MAG TPA: prolipoprotein diacylglyceryl transferase [Candidatus Limnocylindrales bacterium]|nr:prolipoprotein diacylglyceryl transferase [Candidatus Limnocylindrales bacterium]
MIDPVAFELGPIQVHWYGIIIASAVLVAGLLGSRVARWLNEDPEDGWSMLLLVMVLAIVGARVYHVIHLWEYYAASPAEIVQIWNGGLGIPGGVAGGALGILLYTRSKGLHTARWMDVFAPALLLGQVIGRLGNFVNQELYGPPTELCGDQFPPCLPWGVQIAAENRAGTDWDAITFPVETTQFVPLFAYEMALNLIGMLALLFVIRRFGPRLFAGDAVLLYVMWYGAVRTALETYRVNNWEILGIPTAMWVGMIGFVLAGGWLWYRHVRGWGSPMIRPMDESRPEPAPASQPRSEASPG